VKRPLLALGNIPVKSSVIASLYPDIRMKNKKIASLESSGEIIRLKKGLFVVSPEESSKLLSIGLIANHIYNPSYVSMSSALRHYGLIPETVYAVQSMTIKHSALFENKVGRFEYTHIDEEAFSVGLCQIQEGDDVYIMASPEKALCDLIANTPQLTLRYIKEAREYLEEDIRMDMDAFLKMHREVFEAYIQVGKKARSIQTVLKLLLKQ
jgi:predicted transcriptional regulator of viral defense system